MTEPTLATAIDRERTLARLAVVFLAIHLVVFAVELAGHVWRLIVLDAIRRQVPGVLASARASDAFLVLVGFFGLLLYVPTVVIYCMWFYRAYFNLRLKGTGGTYYSPGWAPGSFFVPFVNVWRPYEITKELWIRTFDGNATESLRPGTKASVAIGLWWLTFLVSGMLSTSSALISRANTVDALRVSSGVLLASGAIGIVSGLLVIRIVRAVDRGQRSWELAVEQAVATVS